MSFFDACPVTSCPWSKVFHKECLVRVQDNFLHACMLSLTDVCLRHCRDNREDQKGYRQSNEGPACENEAEGWTRAAISEQRREGKLDFGMP